ncbi:MAG TPA: VIT1/CCC1 transporter family protein [Verrucomicrobiae bacterium]|jgi:VIT1/CCC1 family predicted Fe2+/Mn2+ transporter|nr:VIT1/CCC1 transporter family protein [Verrucomicrobiae bacterium]
MTDSASPVQAVVVDTPGWRNVKPRIPDTQQRRQLQSQRQVREIVFGAQDGILTTMGIVTGLGAATGNHVTVVITGGLALLAGALSMGVGEFQGGKSERDVVAATIEMERGEMEAHPQDEFAEQVAYYKTKGFSAEEAHTIVSRLTKNPEIYLYEMIRDEFGIDPRVADESSLRPAIAMALAYSVGSVLPIVPYALPISSIAALIASVALALVGLFAIGCYAGALSGRRPIARALEIVAYGVVVFALTLAAGHFIPPLFGHAPVSIGG